MITIITTNSGISQAKFSRIYSNVKICCLGFSLGYSFFTYITQLLRHLQAFILEKKKKMHTGLSWQRRWRASIFDKVGTGLGWRRLVQVKWPDVAACTQCFNKHTWRTYSLRMAACQFGSILGVKQKGMNEPTCCLCHNTYGKWHMS